MFHGWTGDAGDNTHDVWVRHRRVHTDADHKPDRTPDRRLAWVDAVSKIGDQTEKAVGPGDIYVTPKKLRSLEKALRICSSELKRIGTPSERLRPVHTLVMKACAEYDKGAACFATAAGYGNPYSGTSSDRKQTAAINCVLDALGDGGTLINDALNKGEEIKAAAG
jgi:hypothetical protein